MFIGKSLEYRWMLGQTSHQHPGNKTQVQFYLHKKAKEPLNLSTTLTKHIVYSLSPGYQTSLSRACDSPPPTNQQQGEYRAGHR